GEFGSNDGQDNAERITQFGLGAGKKPAVRVLGQLSPPALFTEPLETEEEQGSIPLATETGIPDETSGVEVDSEIGDGEFGSAGTGSGDFDFFKVTASAGEAIRANTAGSDFDTILIVYDADGNILASNDDANGTFQSDLTFLAPADGDYFVLVTGFLCLPEDPFDPSSGTGAESEGAYHLEITVGPLDQDFYAVRLKPGDVLGGMIKGAAIDMTVHKPNGEERIVSEFADASFIYPMQSPLPGAGGDGNASFAYVAEEGGWYTVSTSNGDGPYQMQLEVYRPGSEAAGPGKTQKIFLDFDGERVNTGVFGGFGVVTLSPLSAFLGRWGLPNGRLNAVIDQVVATVKENIKQDLVAKGLNPNVKVKVLNSRDDPDPFGNPNVSRVIVGGTIAQSGVPTIGIAQSIDPGNFAHEETALVLLDTVSDPDPNDDASFNFYFGPGTNKVKFIGTALGNVVSHETGHFVGSFHVDQFNDVLNLMDQGGNFALLYGVGDDGVGGTADDPDVDFGVDTYNPNEGFAGLENTLNNTAWAFRPGQ
ncbi:MAG TPA: PPC domain-containing protein, partial [Nocardioidaceae bacterium]